MAEFEPESSGVGNDYSADCATTIAHEVAFYYCLLHSETFFSTIYERIAQYCNINLAKVKVFLIL